MSRKNNYIKKKTKITNKITLARHQLFLISIDCSYSFRHFVNSNKLLFYDEVSFSVLISKSYFECLPTVEEVVSRDKRKNRARDKAVT